MAALAVASVVLVSATASARLTASPNPALVGQSVSFTPSFTASAQPAGQLTIDFGDGSARAVAQWNAPVFHTYAQAGQYVAQLFLSPFSALSAQQAQSIARVVVSVNAEQAPGGLSVSGVSLTWPNGASSLSLSGSTVPPKPLAIIQSSGSGTLVVRWLVDGKTLSVATQQVTSSGNQRLQLSSALPNTGSHSVALSIVSPQIQVGSAPTPAPPITYSYSSSAAAGTIQLLHFQGFDVTNLRLNGNTQPSGPLSGDGAAHVAALQFRVQFANIRVDSFNASDNSADVRKGTATIESGTVSGSLPASCVAPGNGIRPLSPSGLNVTSASSISNVANVPAGAVSKIPIQTPSKLAGSLSVTGGFKAGVTTFPFPLQSLPSAATPIGTFCRFDYPFGLIDLTLNPISKPSVGDLQYQPATLTTASDEAYWFSNASFAGNYSLNPNAQPQQLVLVLSKITLDQNGEFTDDVPGDQIGSYRLGYSTFRVDPTHAQTLKLRFRDSDPAPHAEFDATPVSTLHLFPQPYPNRAYGTITTCSWMPNGVNANFSITNGQKQYPNEPAGFSLTMGANSLSVQSSIFMGGTMSGSWNASDPEPANIGNRYTPILTPVVRAAATFNAAQTAAAHGSFLPVSKLGSSTAVPSPGSSSLGPRLRASTTISLVNLFNTTPSGTFSGNYTALGDLVATVGTANNVSAGSYGFTETTASLYVPGGQVSHSSHNDFVSYVQQLAGKPPFTGGGIPQLQYGISFSNIVGRISGIITQATLRAISSGTQNKNSGGLVISASNAVANSAIQSVISGIQLAESTPAFPYPGVYIAAGSVTSPYSTQTGNFSAQASGLGYGWVFIDGGGVSGDLAMHTSERLTFQQFPVNMQIMDLLLLDGGIIAQQLWGAVHIPAPIDSDVPLEFQGGSLTGNAGTPTVPAGAVLSLTGWDGTLTLNSPAALGDGYINVQSGQLQLPGLPQPTAAAGQLLASGVIGNNGTMSPVNASNVTRLAGLDFTVQTFQLPATGQLTNIASSVTGTGTFPQWVPSGGQQVITLGNGSGSFQPPNQFKFSISENLALTSFSVSVQFSGNDTWNGQGQMQAANFVTVGLSFLANDSTLQVTLNGSFGDFANISGSGTFNRSGGALEVLSFQAKFNLSGFSAQVTAGYNDTSASFVQSNNLVSECSKAWCFDGQANVDLGAGNSLSGELICAVFNGFKIIINGTLVTQVDTFQVTAEFGFTSATGDWDFQFGLSGVRILGIPFNGNLCVWNHSHGMTGQCVWSPTNTNVSETGVGFYVSGGINWNFDIGTINVSVFIQLNGGNFSAGENLAGNVNLYVASGYMNASLVFSAPPPQFNGTGSAGVCIFCACGSVSANVTMNGNAPFIHISNPSLNINACGISL
jgi:hypothetical protein